MEGHAAPSSTSAPACRGSAAATTSTPVSACESVIKQRLIRGGVAADRLTAGPGGLIEFVNEDRTRVPAAVFALFPDVDEVKEAAGEDEAQSIGLCNDLLSLCEEAVDWAQWLLFNGDPNSSLANMSGGERGVCGAVWGYNDIAYRCRTCEHDPTCAICVPCFQAGDHESHDYSVIRTGGGCCDCGDPTAWNSAGFCSHHRGPGLVPPLPPDFVSSASPVLEAVLRVWASKLGAAHEIMEKNPKKRSLRAAEEKVASQTSLAVIDMLLKFCNSSESILNFTAKSMGMNDVGILDALFRTEAVLQEGAVKRLHELLYKLLGDTAFKYSFAQEFIAHYSMFVRDFVQEDLAGFDGRSTFSNLSDHTILVKFSVQIFTVPTLTFKLVFESKLLDILFDSLKQLFLASVGGDGRLLVSKGRTMDKLCSRVLEDIRYVMSHLEVSQYVAQETPQLARAWMEIVAFVQGMYPQRRVFNIPAEDELEDWQAPFFLEIQMAAIHPLFGKGAAFEAVDESAGNAIDDVSKSTDDDPSIIRHAKLGRITKGTDGMNVRNGVDIEMDDVTNASCAGIKQTQSTEVSRDGLSGVLPAPLLWIVADCISVLDGWLASETAKELAESPPQLISNSASKSSVHRRTFWRGRMRGPRNPAVLLEAPDPPPASASVLAPAPAVPADAEGASRGCSTLWDWPRRSRRQFSGDSSAPDDRSSQSATSNRDSADMDVDTPSVSEASKVNEGSSRDWWMGSTFQTAGAGQLSPGESWPKIDFDVGRQNVSFHIPIHRMLAILVHKALESHSLVRKSSCRFISLNNFSSLSQLFPEKYQAPGFSAFMMEHPLRLQVLCAQVQAGMWRRNGHTTSALCDLYRTGPWGEDCLELDLLMLQCCSVMAPPDSFVDRIQNRFGLAEYFSLQLEIPNEYDANLARDFLVLLIRLCAERGFCGLSPLEALRRDLVQRLALGDATHSSLLKALPRRMQDSQHLEECLSSVAVYRNPSGLQQGKYALREECWCELDLYHPRWSLTKLQTAEDRYLRTCKVPAIYMQLPRWKKPFAPLQDMGRFIVSARMHDILRSVFFHAAFAESLSASRAPEGLLFAAIHLLALALDVCSSLSPFKQGGDGGHIADQDAGSSHGPDARHPHRSPQGLWSSNGCEMLVDEVPLLALSIERVPVYGIDGIMMPKSQSLLTLLVLLLHKYNSTEPSSGMQTEFKQYDAGDLIKSLLRKFADVHRECMYEIESLAPEILHRRSVKLPTSGATDRTKKDENKTLSGAQKHKAMAREYQQAVMEKMKAAQARFAATLQEEDHDSDQKDGERSRKVNEMGGVRYQDSVETTCALCRDSRSASPFCFLALAQKSRILTLARSPIPCWTSFKNGVSEGKRIEISENALDNGKAELYTEADLQDGFHHTLGDGNHDRMRERESLPELLRSGLHPGETVQLLRPGGSPGVISRKHVAAPADEGEGSGENNEIEPFQEGPSVFLKCWADNSGTANSEEWSSREVGLLTVLAEYVAAVSRDCRRQVGTEQPRAAEIGQGSGTVRSRRVPRRNITDASMSTGLGLSDTSGVYLSACGHAVHQDCLDRYLSTLLDRYYSRARFEGVQIVDPDMGELLCPVCRRLANSIIPLFPGSLGHDAWGTFAEVLASRDGYCMSDMNRCSSRAIQLQQALHLLSNAENVIRNSGFRKTVSSQIPNPIKGSLDTLSDRLHGLFIPDREPVAGPNGQTTESLHIWDVFRYTLMSVELATRTKEASTCMLGSLSRLVMLEEAVDPAKGSVLPLLFQAAQAVQGQSLQAVLMRSRGLQLLVDSVAHGASRNLFAKESGQGKFSSLVHYLETATDSADVQFWRRMADPVLLHDPFSSLVWSIFSLPSPLPLGEAPFTALVHLYYVVCLTQVIAYAAPLLASDVGPSASKFVKVVQAALSGHLLIPDPRKFSSIPPCPAVDALRLLTLPYLRQCFLLQKLMSASGQVLPVPSAHFWELSQNAGSTSVRLSGRNLASDAGEDERFVLEELEMLEQLDSHFSIPPLMAVLNDDNVQAIAMKWCHHVRSEAGAIGLRQIPRAVRAVPFKLMKLPSLYQDLLQRYVKERCFRCGCVPDKPALCLLCGSICCAFSSRSSSRQAKCYRDAMACGAGIGVFLMVRETYVLLQRLERQALWPSPYLDVFGEEDLEGRGKPLFLSEDRYSALTAMVASHGLDYSSLVLSRTSRQML